MQQSIITDKSKDPLGSAVLDFYNGKLKHPLTTQSSTFEDDDFPVSYLFRTFEQMPVLEQKALKLAKGNILDVGACAGCHSLALQKMGKSVSAIDISATAVEVMLKTGVTNARHINFFNLQNEKYDTLLFLMNGAGIAGTIATLPFFFNKIKTLLNKGGQVLIDSSDVAYLYKNEDGSIDIDINGAYYGEFDFTFAYGDCKSASFSWLYVDIDTLKHYAHESGFKVKLIMKDDNNAYLAKLSIL